MGPEDEDDLREQGVIENDEDEGQDGDGEFDDELDSDEDLDLSGQAATGKDGSDRGGKDDVRSDEGQAGHGSPEVKRGNPEYGKLRAERREAREKADRLERELQELRQSQLRNQGPDAAEQRRQQREQELNAAREEPAKYWDLRLKHQQEDADARINQIQFMAIDSADKTAFEALAYRNKAAASLRNEVEQRLADERRRGLNFPRETVLKFLLGERALKNGDAARTRQQNKADVTNRRETVKAPRAARSDTGERPSKGGDDRTKRAQRLDGQII